MPFVSRRDARERTQSLTLQQEFTEPSTYGETLNAGLGGVVDEAQSTSMFMNRQGYADRRDKAEALINSGSIDREKYFKYDKGARSFDYDKLNVDFDDIKTDTMLKEERNLLLKNRREYREDVFKNSDSMTAQFLGEGLGYMLDPITIATLPLSYSVSATTALSAVGRTMLKAGSIEAGAELGIQSFVVGHKNDIDSPYSYKDAITAIGTVALGSAVLSGTAKGIGEYITKVRAETSKLTPTEESIFADETLARIEDTLRDNPFRKEGMTSEELVKADSDFLTELETRRKNGQPNEARPKEEIDEPVISGKADILTRESQAMESQATDYAQDILAYEQKFNTVDEASAAKVETDAPEKLTIADYLKTEVEIEADAARRTVYYADDYKVALTTSKADNGYMGGTLEIDGDISAIGGKGSATAVYLQALKNAAGKDLGWESEGLLSNSSLRMYERLKELGFDFKPKAKGNGFTIEPEDIKKGFDATKNKSKKVVDKPAPKAETDAQKLTREAKADADAAIDIIAKAAGQEDLLAKDGFPIMVGEQMYNSNDYLKTVNGEIEGIESISKCLLS